MTVTLFGTHFNAYAANNVLKNDAKGTITTATSGSSYDAIEATNGGAIKGENLIVTSPDPEKFSTGVASKDSGSEITLTGTTTIEKVKDGLSAEKGGKITSENLIINGTNIGLVAQDSGSKIELTGTTTIEKMTNGLRAVGGAAITSNALTITLNEAGESNVGVYVQDANSKIELNGKTTIKNATNHGLMAVNGAIVSKDLTLTGAATQGTSIGIGAYSPNSKIELNGKTTIEKFKNGLVMNNGAAIKIDGASITASEIGASFSDSKNNETTLENVNISSGNDGALMDKGINAEKSTVTLNNVTVTQANTGIFANDHSTITVSGGSFDGKTDGVYAKEGSTINLTGDAKITSTDGYGLHAEGSGSKITKEKETVTGKQAALFAEKGGQIDVTDVTLTTTDGSGTGAKADGADSMITLKGKTTIKKVTNGLQAVGGAAITSKDLTITLNEAGESNVGVSVQDSNSKIELKGKTTIKNATNHGLMAVNGAIVSEDLTLIGSATKGTSIGIGAYTPNSKIELNGKTIIEKFKNGLVMNNGAAIKIDGASITASEIGASFNGSKNNETTLENVNISSGNDGTLMDKGISAEKSTVALNNVTVTQANTGIFANDHSTITVSGGSFDGKNDGVYAKEGSTINLDEKAAVTSSDGSGLHAEGSGAKITKTGGTVSGKQNALFAEKGGQIDVTDVALTTTDSTGTGAKADGANSVITLKGTTTIEKVINGLDVQNGATAKMTGGSIAASQIGALFNASGSDENKNTLEDVTISSGNDGTLMDKGISAEKSTVALNNVTVTQANTGIFANDHSTITVSGGSFDGKTDGVYAKEGSTITLNNNVTVASSNGNGLRADGSGSKITMAGGKVTTIGDARSALFAEKGGQIDATNVALTTDGKGTGAEAIGPDSRIELHGDTTINNTWNGLGAILGGKITSENLTVVGGEIIDQDPNEKRSGVWTGDSGSEIQLTGKTTIQNVDEGLYADSGGKIVSGDLTITGGKSTEPTVGVNIWEPDSVVELNGKTTIQNVDAGLFAVEGSTIKTSNGTIDTNSEGLDTQSDTPPNGKKNKIEAKKAALVVINGGHIDLTDVSATAEVAGLQFATFSDNDPNGPDYPQKYHSNEINLTNAEIHAENDTGILVGAFVEKSIEDAAAPSIGTVNLKKSEVHADVLLGDGIFWDKTSWKDKDLWDGKEVKAISNGTFTLNADQSTLEGRANIAQDRNVHFDLKNDTTWTLKISKNEKDNDGNLLDIAQRSRSDISTLSLDNSSIVFSEPTEEHYQTLHIGSGKPDTKAVYNATGGAKIYFNAKWSDGAAINDQKTDRLLINGDVSGNTSVYVTGRLEDDNVEANTSAAANIRGLSLIQVSGKAEESSFKLVNGYTTRGGLPDMYTLRAYGPDSSQGKANIAQNLFDEKNENFWDFRLQPELLGNGSDVIAPVAQTASYLVMPNALFYSGLTDMAKQNALLANIRTSILGKEEEKQTGFFLYTYGSTGTLSSERGPLKYGYGADIRYAALQAGVTLAAIEGQNTTTHLGLVGTYGQLSFTPKDMSDAGKNTLDKWSLTAYGSIQHNSGFYIDALLSYGILKGHIANAIRGNTAKLNDAKMFSISTTIGKEFATNMEGLTFEPQAQVAYQHLMFNTIEDADNFTVDMNNPSQWLIRVGGRLTKTISTENNRPMSFYGKVNLIKTFGDDGTIHIGRDFDLDPMGPAIEGGIGINAQLSHNFSLHGDVSYQQKLQKTGISGASFSGGIRYQF